MTDDAHERQTARPQIHLLYKTPGERQLEFVCGLILGIPISIALRDLAKLDAFLSLFGLLAGTVIVSVVTTWILRWQGRMIPAAEVHARKLIDNAKRPILLAILERVAAGFVMFAVVVLLIVAFDPPMPLQGWFLVFASLPPWFFALPLIFVGWAFLSAWRRERRYRRTTLLPKAPRRWGSFIRAYLSHKIAFEALAVVLFLVGIAGTFLFDGGARPAAAGIFCSSAIYFATRLASNAVAGPSTGIRTAAAAAMVGTLLYGLPMAMLFESLAVIAAIDQHAAQGVWAVATAVLLITPQSFAIALAGGLTFCFLVLGLVSAAMRISPFVEVRPTPAEREDQSA
jgi:hypothetical protein